MLRRRTPVTITKSQSEETTTTLEEVIEEGKRVNLLVEEEATGSQTPSLSRSPSLHSCITSVPSLHSHSRYSAYKGGSFSDDLKSDVPTIAESIADMQDFADLPVGGYSRATDDTISVLPQRSFRSSSGSAISRDSNTMIDSRLHPLGVLASAASPSYSSTMSESQSSSRAAVGDLGGVSDVPSVRDDMSVASAPSEICVSFPPTICSETGSVFSSGTTSKRLHGCKSPGSGSRVSIPKIRIPRPRDAGLAAANAVTS